ITNKGTMSGIAFHNGNPSKATGIYTNVWNVGPRNGIASVQFNGAAFGGGTTPNTFAVGNSSVFVTPTPLPSTTGVPGRSLSLVGTTSPTSQVGGFVITGPRYGAVGTFQGTKQ
ncbi:MAG: hypothetical protein Q8K93_07090, partial [Reyranella sp.]|nr:hypothetical protein [Reyranella sp.]